MTKPSRSQGSESSDHTISGRSRGADAPAIHTKMTNKKFEDAVQEFAKDLGAKRVEYMGFETKIVYALAIDEINSLRSQLADARQRNIKLNEELGKAQSRDSSTTNKMLRKEIGHKDEVIKWLAIHAEHINRLQPSGCYMVNFKFLEKPEDWIEAAEEAIHTKMKTDAEKLDDVDNQVITNRCFNREKNLEAENAKLKEQLDKICRKYDALLDEIALLREDKKWSEKE